MAPSEAASPSLAPTEPPITGRIAYVHNSGAVGGVPVTDIWLIKANGRQPSALTHDPENEFSPVWLLDGSRLVFAVFNDARNPYLGRLVSVLPDGSGRKDLAPVANYGGAVVSPDGRYVAWGGGGYTDGSDGITLLDRATGEAGLLTTDGATDPIWSPDGKALLAREPFQAAAVVAKVPSGHLTRFETPNVEAVLGWTPDGASIVFQTSSDTRLAPAAGGSALQMPPTAVLASPTWRSPDGRWIVGQAPKGYGLGVWAAGSGETSGLARGLTMLTGAPSWSPDGRAVVLAGGTPSEVGEGRSSIWVIGLDGRMPGRITSGPLDTSPTWDPAS